VPSCLILCYSISTEEDETMRILILGGTVFLGKHSVLAALERGHAVTILHRGDHPARDLPAGVREILGDRTGDLAALAGLSFDAVLDTSGYVPRLVRHAAETLAPRVGRYCFISTLSVYAERMGASIDETAPLAVLEDPATEIVTNETYGPLKAACETVVRDVFADRALIIRPGLIVGPDDPSDRFTYWPHRVAQGGEVLAPDAPDHPTQFIEVRDLAAWTVHMLETDGAGIFNATGPAGVPDFGTLLTACQVASNSDARFTWVSEDFLAEQGVAPYTEMPLWVPRAMVAFSGVDCSRARAAGLTTRPLAETVAATLAWDAARPPAPLHAGLTPEREGALLAAWGGAA
jgi:2'-hydroxyisoflavone reductase